MLDTDTAGYIIKHRSPGVGAKLAAIPPSLVTTGRAIGEMDMMIAAHSLAATAVLVTNNVRHYERIPDLPRKGPHPGHAHPRCGGS